MNYNVEHPIFNNIEFVFSPKQKGWFHQRDNNECQFPVFHSDDAYTPCGNDNRLQVHHISPQRWSKDVPHWNSGQIDSKDNGIVLCEEHHQLVHEDMHEAHANYKRNKKSYEVIFQRRDREVKQKQKYWNPRWDELFKRIAIARNKTFDELFPR